MFSWFRKSASSEDSTRVAPLLKGSLQPIAALPVASLTAFGDVDTRAGCRRVGLEGTLPEAAIVAPDAARSQLAGYLVPADSGGAALLVANYHGAREYFEIWELGAGAEPRALRRREFVLDPAAGSWLGYTASDLVCLPAGQLAIAVSYNDPRNRSALYQYDRASGGFVRLGEAVPGTRRPNYYLDVLDVGADSRVLAYASGSTRLAAEIYYNAFTHLRLYSPRHPEGVAVLDLAAADGNVIAWRMDGTRLQLAAVDKRRRGDDREKFWSLDLAAALR